MVSGKEGREIPPLLVTLKQLKNDKSLNLTSSSLVSLTCSILQMLDKTHLDEDIFHFRISDLTSRASNDIGLKLGLQSILAERNTMILKEINVNVI